MIPPEENHLGQAFEPLFKAGLPASPVSALLLPDRSKSSRIFAFSFLSFCSKVNISLLSSSCLDIGFVEGSGGGGSWGW